MKLPGPFIAAFVLIALALYCSGCKKAPGATPGSGLSFSGNYYGSATCLLAGAQSDTLNIAATGAALVSVTNLYGLEKPVTGVVSNDSCVIQPQLCGGYVVQGLLLLSSDTITMSIIASSFGKEDRCNAVLVRH